MINRKGRKLLATILALALFMSLLPMGAMAQEKQEMKTQLFYH